jgi:hypothetical protein
MARHLPQQTFFQIYRIKPKHFQADSVHKPPKSKAHNSPDALQPQKKQPKNFYKAAETSFGSQHSLYKDGL